MISFINKYKRWVYLLLFAVIIVMIFVPFYRDVELQEGKSRVDICFGTARLFQWHNLYATKLSKGYDVFGEKIIEVGSAEKIVDLGMIIPVVFGEIFIVAGILIAITTIIFINKTNKIPFSIPFLLVMIATIIKRKILSFDAWSDYVIISIALLMLIVDIVRLSLYIRNHRQQIAAKLSTLKPPPRERKPSKDERIAELEERVRQLEDSKKDG